MDISVLISTFNRHEGLTALMEACAAQRDIEAWAVEYVLVDNSTDANARELVSELDARLPITIRYFHEPRPGLARGRNRGIAEAAGEWLVFVDDDEIPESDWLSQLRQAADRYDADVVFGPVFPLLEPSDTDVKAAAEAFFTQSSDAPSGTPIVRGTFVNRRLRRGRCTRVMASNNVIFRREHARALGELAFDPALGQYGGADQIFFERLIAAGATRVVWCREAVVKEVIPADRQSRAYIINRSYRHGQMESGNALTRQQPLRLIKSILIGLAQVPVGAAIWACAPINPRLGFRGQRLFNVGRGRVLFSTRFRAPLYGK